MKWYHFSVEYFEDLRNVNHCEFLIMKLKRDSGKYILQNKLRTWSELRRERAAIKIKEQGESPSTTKDEIKLSATPVVKRQWGGCPEGCSHSKHFKIRKDLFELRQHDEASANSNVSYASTNGNDPVVIRRTTAPRKLNSSDDDSDDPRGMHPSSIDAVRAHEEGVSSPNGTPSLLTVEDRLRHNLNTPKKTSYLHIGRDFGGTYSGHASEEDLSESDARKRLATRAARVRTGDKNGTTPNGSIKESGAVKYSSRHAHANRLGDAPSNSDQGSDGSFELEEDLDKAEEVDRSVRGSIY